MMHSPSWNPQQYLRHAGNRARPFFDLLAQVGDLPRDPARIIDLGCGAGNLTVALADRWPTAHITGLDSSPDMLADASSHAGVTTGGSIDFGRADAATWQPEEPIDLLVANAVLQWVPRHVDNFKRWVDALTPGGTFAFQVPGNFAAPSHALMRELASAPRWRDRLGDVLRADPVLQPAEYLDALTQLDCAVDAWETTYLHVLEGADPVLDWVTGTGLRPILDALADTPAEHAEFVAEYRRRLRLEYPAKSYGTVFPFRRIFVVANRHKALH